MKLLVDQVGDFLFRVQSKVHCSDPSVLLVFRMVVNGQPLPDTVFLMAI